VSVELRTASRDDLVACREIFFASYNDLHRRFAQREEDPDDHAWIDDALAHVLGTDPRGTVIALRDGDRCGFASSFRRDDYWFLSFLFVLPEAQGLGIGRNLLEAVLPSEEVTRALVVESFQPTSTGLYAAYGITPRSVRYRMIAPSNLGRLPPRPSEIRAEAVDDSTLEGFSDLDRPLLGFSRPQDHRWLLGDGVQAWAYRRRGVLVGYGYRGERGVGPALGIDEPTLCLIVADLLRRSEGSKPDEIPVRGETAELFRMLVRAGGRIEPSGYLFLYCSSDGPLPACYVDHAGYMP
jgi:GNAT superfamily N-acetyltransferase